MSLPKYPNYKPSGVAWLGDVPEHWAVEPFKRQIARNDGGVWGDDPDGVDDTIVLRSTEQTVDGRWQLDDPAPRKLSETERNAALLADGDLLVTKSSGSSLHIGKTTLVTPEIAAMRCCYSNFMQRIRTEKSLLPKVAWYVMNNDLARLQFDLLSNSSTGLANLNATMIGQVVVAVPPLPEQTAIAAFLDRETGKIDALVAEQRRLIELLKEKRQAVISHAVTKGLDPHAKLKPSGIEWLGDVPEHWTQTALKHLGRIISGFAFKSEDFTASGIRVLKIANIQTYSVDWTDESFLPAHFYESHLSFAVLDGDVVFALTRPIISTGLKAAIATIGEERVVLNQRNAVFRLGDRLLKLFAYHVLFSDSFRVEFENRIDRTGQQPNISPIDIGNIQIPLPPIDEQERIGSHLEKVSRAFDTLTAEAERAIELLQERRTALISAAVTGKIDVRS